MKQTISIPEGCTGVTIEQVCNQIIATFEPSQPKFKRGDVCIDDESSVCVVDKIQGNLIYEIVGVINGKVTFSDSTPFIEVDCSRNATPEEAQRLWDALAKKGKRWNPETMQVEDIKRKLWRAEKFGTYYTPVLKARWYQELRDSIDNFIYESGFYCQTEEQADRLYEVLKKAATDFWKEELK